MSRKLCHITAVLMIVSIVITGCGGRKTREYPSDREAVQDHKGITISNNIAADEGSILTCAAGYEKKGSKKALVQDMDGASEFYVIDVETDEPVFDGKVKYKKDTAGDEETVGICDLTLFDGTGSFYIRVNTGRVSNVFTIEENIYKRLLSDRMSSLGEDSSVTSGHTEENIGACYMRITDYLLAQEFFPDSISPVVSDKTRIIPRTTLLAKSEIDALRDCVREDGSLKAPFEEDLSAQYLYCAIFALFAYEYREYDNKYSRECTDIAEKVYDTAKEKYQKSALSDKKAVDDKRYWASAQLYKLTGKPGYREAAESYISETPTGWNEDSCGYLGTLAYLTCYNRIDLDLSGQLVSKLMDDINEVVRESFKGDYLVSEDEIKKANENATEVDDSVIDKLYENARLTVLGNYISKNIKYVECGENHLAYLYGRNLLGKDYAYAPDAEYYDEPQMFILAGLIDSYIYEDKEPEAMEK